MIDFIVGGLWQTIIFMAIVGVCTTFIIGTLRFIFRDADFEDTPLIRKVLYIIIFWGPFIASFFIIWYARGYKDFMASIIVIIGGILFLSGLICGISIGKRDARFISNKWVFKDVNPYARSDKYYHFTIPEAVFYRHRAIFGGLGAFIIGSVLNFIFEYIRLIEIYKIIDFLITLSSAVYILSAIVTALLAYKKETMYLEKLRKIIITEEEWDTIGYWQSAGINSAEWREWTFWFNNELSPKIDRGAASYSNFPPWKRGELLEGE